MDRIEIHIHIIVRYIETQFAISGREKRLEEWAFREPPGRHRIVRENAGTRIRGVKAWI